jgi:hypothetical protein
LAFSREGKSASTRKAEEEETHPVDSDDHCSRFVFLQIPCTSRAPPGSVVDADLNRSLDKLLPFFVSSLFADGETLATWSSPESGFFDAGEVDDGGAEGIETDGGGKAEERKVKLVQRRVEVDETRFELQLRRLRRQ